MNCRCHDREPRRRPILKFPHPEKQFPERSKDWTQQYPALIKPWIGGVRAYWIHELQAFQIFDTGEILRVDGIEPYIPEDVISLGPCNLLGEFYEKYKSHAQLLSQVRRNEPSQNLKFNIFDAERPDSDALTRAEYCMNLPYQSDRGTLIVQMFQVNKDSSFSQWLNQWKGSLFLGALTVGYQDPWLSTEFEVAEL